jgi:hypothetical protein
MNGENPPVITERITLVAHVQDWFPVLDIHPPLNNGNIGRKPRFQKDRNWNRILAVASKGRPRSYHHEHQDPDAFVDYGRNQKGRSLQVLERDPQQRCEITRSSIYKLSHIYIERNRVRQRVRDGREGV